MGAGCRRPRGKGQPQHGIHGHSVHLNGRQAGWGLGRSPASLASSLCQFRKCPRPLKDACPTAPLAGTEPQEGLLPPPHQHLQTTWTELSRSLAGSRLNRQCPPAHTHACQCWERLAQGQKRHLQPREICQAPLCAVSPQHLAADPNGSAPPTTSEGAGCPGLGSAGLSLSSGAPVRHPSSTRAGKFAGGGPPIPQPAPEASERARTPHLPRPIRHPHPGRTPPTSGGPPSGVWTSEAFRPTRRPWRPARGEDRKSVV